MGAGHGHLAVVAGLQPEDVHNQPLYPQFTDPLSVTNMEIVEFDEQRGEVHPFQVAQVDVKGKTRWSIPSHDDYPADAKDQVASAAAGLMGLKILEMVSDNQGDQQEYGVVDPDPKVLKVGATGVGQRVIMKDKQGKELLALVIGKEVPGRPGLRYVRKVGQAPIYVVEVKTDKLSTKFEDFIERNLLGINSFDVKRLWIRDYSVDQLRQALVQRGETMIEYNDTGEPKWKLVEDRKFAMNKEKPGEGQWVAVKMPADEELNTAKLDELKTALDDLKIVDVSRKPAGLSADLKEAADFKPKNEAFVSLAEKGFFLTPLRRMAPWSCFQRGRNPRRHEGRRGVRPPLRRDRRQRPGEEGRQEEGEAGGREGQERQRHEPLPVRDGRVQPRRHPQAAARAAPPAQERRRKEARRGEEAGRQEGRREEAGGEEAGRQEGPRRRARADREGEQAEAGGVRSEDRRREEAGRRAERPLRRLVLRHLRRGLPQDPPRPRRDLQEEGEAQGSQGARQKKDEHAGHDHGAAKDEATPAEKLEKMQKEGPGGKK